MVQKAAFRGWMIDAYLEGRIDEIPAHLLEVVADIARRRTDKKEEESYTASSAPFGDAQE